MGGTGYLGCSLMQSGFCMSTVSFVYILGICSKLFKEGIRLHQECVLIQLLFVVFVDRISRGKQDWRGVQCGGTGGNIPVIRR